MGKKRIPRSNTELIQALRGHIDLLREYHNKAFNDGDSKYLGEVAGKLRLLVYDRGRNTPLLKNIMKKFNIDVRLEMIGRAFPKGANIDEYFNHVCGAFRPTDGKKPIEVTPLGIVATWAQQMGSSHEDPSLGREFAELIHHGFFINGRQIAVDELRRASKFILLVADYFFQDLEKLKK